MWHKNFSSTLQAALVLKQRERKAKPFLGGARTTSGQELCLALERYGHQGGCIMLSNVNLEDRIRPLGVCFIPYTSKENQGCQMNRTPPCTLQAPNLL